MTTKRNSKIAENYYDSVATEMNTIMKDNYNREHTIREYSATFREDEKREERKKELFLQIAKNISELSNDHYRDFGYNDIAGIVVNNYSDLIKIVKLREEIKTLSRELKITTKDLHLNINF